MDEARERTQALRDERLPLLPALLGEDAGDLLAEATALAGGAIEEWRVSNVTWQPGSSLTVRYEAHVRWPTGPATESFVATTGSAIPAAALQFEREGARAALWRLPFDAGLPGLAAAMDPVTARHLLDSVGAPAGDVSPVLRAYRPGRRAVVHLRGETVDAYAKVVRPHRVAALQKAHRIAAEVLPVPRSFGWSAEHGVVLLQALHGITFREALQSDSPLPAPSTIANLLDLLPVPANAALAPDPVESARGHAGLLRRLVPDQAWKLDAVLAQLTPTPPNEPLVPVHGDLYEAQLMTDGTGALTGMLDIDTIGLGHRVNDWANFIGHLATWEAFSPNPGRVRQYARQLLAHADRECSPELLRQRIAAVIVGLATGPFRVQQADWPTETRRRIALAGEWLASAERVAKQRRRAVLAAR